MISQIEQAKARGGIVAAVATDGDAKAAELADYVFWVPENAVDAQPGDHGDPATAVCLPDCFAARLGCGPAP